MRMCCCCWCFAHILEGLMWVGISICVYAYIYIDIYIDTLMEIFASRHMNTL